MYSASFFKGKRITVFGLGLNMGGVGTVAFLVENGAREVIVTDIKKRDELGPSIEKLAKYKNIKYVLGQHRPEDFTRVDMVIKNPVIPWNNDYIKLAQKSKVPVEMDSSLFFDLCKAPIIGVTGSKGKTTTASLIAHILESAGRKVVRVGISQIGVLSTLRKITPESVVVFELSSWRLSGLSSVKKSPKIAVLTNIYPDHLNYYKTLASYMEDKKNIFRFQKKNDLVVASFDNAHVREMVQDAPGDIVFVSGEGPLSDDGVFADEGMLFVRQDGKEKIVFPLDKMPLRGEHNISNVLSAIAATLAFGLKLKEIAKGVETFSGVTHRLEMVLEKKGVRFYNDSAATIPEASMAALRSFSDPVILIAGGSDKRLDFSAFAEEILAHSKGLVFLKGEATEKLLSLLREITKAEGQERDFPVVETMEKAVELASREAEAGDVVLLSPGAASFGLFKNEFDRGEQFKQAVLSLR
ncbi:MAG: UDP-N-acetylmuramoyl-L-alanine--D-glutamate ligase [Patescibacteria group bacterium]